MGAMGAEIMVVADLPLTRASWGALLTNEGGLHCVGEAADAPEARRLAAERKPLLAVVDELLEPDDALELTRALTELSVRVVMVATERNRFHAAEAFAAGALGYVTIDDAGDALAHALREVAQGGRYVSATPLREERRTSFEALTRREREVLALLLRGLHNKDISRTLFISQKTVETHRTKIYRKLCVHSVAELILLAHRQRALAVG